jgi:flavin reductase (DIM6/NTAB) family NADH-FMN oxidoreductase RutF
MSAQKTVSYSEAIGKKYPEQVVIAIAKDKNGVPNPITLGWTMVTSHKPPMMAISVAFARYSYEVIKEAKEFVISFPSQEMAKDVLFFGTRSGRDMDKIKEFATSVMPCGTIDCVILSDAVANFECRLKGTLETGDHALFAGEIIHAWINTKEKKRLYTVGSGYKMGTAEPNIVIEYTSDLFT